MSERPKPIPQARDRLQSTLLVWTVAPLLVFMTWFSWTMTYGFFADSFRQRFAILAWIVSLTFAVVVWALRAATLMAATNGGMICLLIVLGTGRFDRSPLVSGLAPLIALFLLTFAATRAGRTRKSAAGLAEPRKGRTASQVLANLGAAAIFGSGLLNLPDWIVPSGGIIDFSMYAAPFLLLAALCEATADTVSSEMGQAFGGTPILLTTLRRVPPGTDGAVSLLGSLAGLLAAALVAAVGLWSMRLSLRPTLIALAGGLIGWLFDSLLGATLERRGWLGNDLVNFSSTLVAVLAALAILTR